MKRTRNPSMLWRPAILIRFAALLGTVVLMLGSDGNCHDSSTSTPTPTLVPEVTLSITSPLPFTVAPGGSGIVTVAVTRINAFTGPVPLTLFDPQSNPTCFSATPVTIPADGSSIDMTVHVSADCPTGTRSFKVEVSQATGYGPAHVDVAATIVAPGAFAISATPTSFPLPGETIHVTATIVRNGYTGSITIATASGGQYVSSATITQPGTGNTADLALVIAPSAFRANGFSQQFTATGAGAPDQSFYVNGYTRGYDFTMSYSPQPVNIAQNGYANIFLTIAQPTNPAAFANITGTFTSSTTGLTGGSFAPAQNGTPTAENLFASAAVPVGDYTMTFTATSTGVATQSMPVSVHVFASSYTFSIQTAPLTVPRGGSVPDAITITRNNMPDAISFTGTADDENIGIGSATATTGNTSTINVFVPNSVSLGTHNATVIGVSPGHNDVVMPFAIIVANASVSVVAAPSPLALTIGTAGIETATLARVGFTGGVTVTAVADDAGISVIPTPSGATTGNSVTLSTLASNATAVGSHTIAVTAASSLPNANTNYTANVSHATDGSQTASAIILVPSTPTVRIGGSVTFTAYLVDGQGNRVLPPAGFNVGFAIDNSAIGTITQANYDNTQRWRTGVVTTGGPDPFPPPTVQTTGSTLVRAFLFNISNGQSTLTATTLITVTP